MVRILASGILKTKRGIVSLDWIHKGLLGPLFGMITLALLTLQTQWGVWNVLNWPIIDESWFLLAGYRLTHGDPIIQVFSWDSPLATISYSISTLLFGSIDSAFYMQRILFSFFAVIAFYWLIRRLMPSTFAWIGAAVLTFSPLLVSLTYDRTDFLAGCFFIWASLAVMDTRSMSKMIWAFFFSLVGALFRPEGFLFLFSVLIFWGAVTMYHRLPSRGSRRILPVAAFVVFSFALVFAVVLIVLTNNKSIDDYFTWVFANNRWNATWYTEEPIIPMWEHFERDYGLQRSILGVLSRPVSLIKDLVSNSLQLFRHSKLILNKSTFGELNPTVSRWILAIGILGIIAVRETIRNWDTEWKTYWHTYKDNWINLICLFPSIFVIIFIRALPVQALLVAPLVVGVSITALLIFFKQKTDLSSRAFLFIVVGLLIFVPSPYNKPSGQMIRSTVNFLHEDARKDAPIAVLGNTSETICPYIQTIWNQECFAEAWSDRNRDITLTEFMAKRDFQYLVYDPGSMEYLLTRPVELAEVVNGSSRNWTLAAEFESIKVYKRAK